jgi:release factor glutamine methyltransferase
MIIQLILLHESRVGLRKKILNKLSPVLQPLMRWYLSKTRTYSYKGIQVKIYPGVFHPGLFFSTKILFDYLESIDVQSKKVLELGAGSGLISIFCAKRGALVTSTDINPVAIDCLKENVVLNDVQIKIVHSDLFDNLSPTDFDLILINPPYYPKAIESPEDLAFFCGPDFDYFKKLFKQLQRNITQDMLILLILSEDCKRQHISDLASQCSIRMEVVHDRKIMGERNYIYTLRSC